MKGDSESEAEQQEGSENLFSGKLPIEVALNQLRLRLLDLTGRNRLVNFRHTPGKSLQFVDTSIDAVFRRLTSDQGNKVTIAPLPEPERRDWTLRNGRLTRPEPKDHAVRIGLNPSFDLAFPSGRALAASTSGSSARTLFYPEDLGKHCRKLEREAKLAIEETGANMLYLVLGFLEFPESTDSDKIYRAPLLCVPVALTRVEEARFSSFHLNYTGEEVAENLSLREKIKRDFGINLPEYVSDDELSAEAYFDEVSDAVAARPNWRVRRMLTLTLLSFANMLLVRDLDPENWPKSGESSTLLDHPLVRQVFEGKPSTAEPQYADEYSIDDHSMRDLPLIFDADSSQHSALIDILEGKNRVIEGPPGTGKSQTITNLIAASLQAGKKVLFVAEKVAALEVVKSRLVAAGLDPFVLELHSNKTSKKRVLEDLSNRIEYRTSQPPDLPTLLERYEQKRSALKAYADLMNSQVSDISPLTLHQVLWRSERHRLKCECCAHAVESLDYPSAYRSTLAQLEVICDRIRYLAAQLEPIGTYGPSHPLWGFFPDEFRPQDDLPVQKALEEFSKKFADFAAAASDAASLLGGTNLNMSAQSAEQLLSLLASVAPCQEADVDFAALPTLFSGSDPLGQGSFAILKDLQERKQSLAQLEAAVREHLLAPTPTLETVAAAASETLDSLTTLGLSPSDGAGLVAKLRVLEDSINVGRVALEGIRTTASSIGLALDGTASAVNKVAAAASCAASAPMHLLHLRHDGLRPPGTARTLSSAQARLHKIESKQSELEASFYLDSLPSEQEVSRAISVLREGSAWYRIFQRRWRSAVRLHRSLEKTKSRKRSEERLHDLEQIRGLTRARIAWNADPALRAAAGPHYSGEQTPLRELLDCAEWLEKSTVALDAAGVEQSALDVFGADRTTLLRLAHDAPLVAAWTTDLAQFDTAVRSILHSAHATVLHGLSEESWLAKIEIAKDATEVLKTAAELLNRHVRPLTPADVGLALLSKSRDIPVLDAELENHDAGRDLLGQRFKGRETKLECLLAAHTYGGLIKRAGLPSRLEQALISEACVENHSRLSAYIARINAGWQAVRDFSAAMSAFGDFSPDLWTDAHGKPTSLYALQLAERTRRAVEHVGGLLVWAQYVAVRREVTALGLSGFVEKLECGAVPSDKIEHAFRYRFYASIAQVVFDKTPTLRQFSGLRHSSIQKDFAALDHEIIRLRGRQIAHECRRQSRPPQGNHGVRVDEKTELKLLEHLIPQQRPRVPVRQMLRRAGRAIQELKPCFMMGPQAVAQFLQPGHLRFDIIVMDEASQLRPEEAIGAIARGTQLVVVGDPKQLPPTSFFARMAPVDGDDDGMGQMATSEAESILDVCISHFQPVRTLRWHYRSRHESLIAFSNHFFYRGKLLVFPSPYPKGKALGLRYLHVRDGIYENQMNQSEARRVVDAVIEHILHRSGDSLGIVTLNIKQRDLVSEMLEERLRALPEAAAFKERWEPHGMGLFIKNLENVQGDERDCIFISTTFGKPRGADVVRQNFGPISREGGWRRLNVLFTRARKSVALFSSMRPEDIVVDSKTPEGTRALRNYLEYARSGILPLDRETDLPPDSEFEVAVMDVLRTKGYEVVPQLGVAGFRIDIAVRHPVHRSGYLAAVECDGASYHSGVSVRDRDRIRQEILESLGWKGRIWRIWSTDWFRNPIAESEKLLQFLAQLRDQPVPDEYSVEPPISEETLAACQEGFVETPIDLVFEDEDEDLEIEIGDLVSYAPVEDQSKTLLVRLTPARTSVELGLVAVDTPLGSVLIGATVGEEVVLRVPGRPPQSFLIVSIKRAPQETTH